MNTLKEQLIIDPGNRVELFYKSAKEFIQYINMTDRKSNDLAAKYKKDMSSVSNSSTNADKKIIEIKEEDLKNAEDVKEKQIRAVEHYKHLLSKSEELSSNQYEIFTSMKNAFDIAYQTKVKEINANFVESKQKIKNLPSMLKEELTKKYETSKSNIESSFKEQVDLFEVKKAELFDEFYETSLADSDVWKSLTSDKTLPFGYITVASSTISCKVFDHIYKFQIPHVIPFFNNKNLIIKCNSRDKHIALDLMNSILIRSLMGLGADNLKLSLVDTLNLSSNYRDLKGLSSKVMGDFITLKSKVSENIQKLYERIIDINSRCLTREFENITKYNIKSAVKEKYNILVLSNFVNDFGRESIEVLNAILSNGPITGVNTIIIQEKEKVENFKSQLSGNQGAAQDVESLDTNSFVIDLDSDSFTKSIGLKFDNIKWETVETLPYNQVVDYINDETGNIDKAILPFEDYVIDQSEWWKAKATNRLEIPVGISRETGKVDNFYIGIELPDASAIMVGAPGSGKSSFIHTLINNACIKYSPDEVNFHLIDLKSVEFADYEKAELRPPHVVTVASDADREFAFSVLESVHNNMTKRVLEFKEKDYKDYEDYRLGESTPLPHEVVIIDEFHRLFEVHDDIRERSKELISSLVRVGRVFGMHTICATQSFEGTIGSEEIVHFPIRCALKSSADVVYNVLGNNDGYKHIQKAGEILINDNFGVQFNGDDNQNRILKSFFISKGKRKNTLTKISEFTKENFEGQVKPLTTFKIVDFNYSENDLVNDLEHIRKTDQVEIILGKAINLNSSDVVINLRKESGANILVIGQDEKLATKLVNNAVMSAVLNYSAPNYSDISIFNSILKDNETYNEPLKYFDNKNDAYNINIENEDDAIFELRGVSKAIDNEEYAENSYFLSFYAFQRFSPARNHSTKSEIKELLLKVLENGPRFGFYVILHIDSIKNLRDILGYDAVEAFEHRIALQMSRSDSDDYIRKDYASKLKDIQRDYTKNYAMYYQPGSISPYRKFIVYSNPSVDWFNNKI